MRNKFSILKILPPLRHICCVAVSRQRGCLLQFPYYFALIKENLQLKWSPSFSSIYWMTSVDLIVNRMRKKNINKNRANIVTVLHGISKCPTARDMYVVGCHAYWKIKLCRTAKIQECYLWINKTNINCYINDFHKQIKATCEVILSKDKICCCYTNIWVSWNSSPIIVFAVYTIECSNLIPNKIWVRLQGRTYRMLCCKLYF